MVLGGVVKFGDGIKREGLNYGYKDRSKGAKGLWVGTVVVVLQGWSLLSDLNARVRGGLI